MNTLEYENMSNREKTYWWHVGRLDILEKQIELIQIKNNNQPLKILNVGCGTGGTIKMLEKHASELINIDVSREATKFMKKAGYKAMLIKDVKLPFKSHEFDLVVAFDVLEHIKDDTQALKEWKRVIKKGGDILISVPAHQWLWSGHDICLQHFRRYNASHLKKEAEKINLKTIRAGYMIAFSFPLVVGFRIFSNINKQKVTQETSYVGTPNIINNLFISFLKIEAKIQKYTTIPIGTSVLARFTK